ncbi:hypothetical protein LIER_00756 [Lithospermum erythrorhizon]|uniref:Uncharacterized protein n=1 Tax=Lithospermum erythrorhizon TaxID=34254 RepID=A0AAV3NIF6_LITER
MSMNTFSLQSINQQNQSLSSFFFPLDHKPQFQEFDSFYERGPRYKAYADLRESKLKSKSTHQEKYVQENDFVLHPSILTPKKEVKFQKNLTTLPKRSKGSSSLAQSVPDFSAMMRKENRKPSSPLPPVVEKNATPPSGSKGRGVMGKLGGSKSVNSGGKKGGSMICRKSYASVEELKDLASIARSGIIAENNNNNNKVGVTTRASSRNILRYSRQF